MTPADLDHVIERFHAFPWPRSRPH
jgi:hypothetical protein